MSIIQRIRFKLELIKIGMQNQMDHGREKSRQIQDDKRRKKNETVLKGKPGAVNTIRRHLLMRSTNPFEVAKDEYIRRKYERDKK